MSCHEYAPAVTVSAYKSLYGAFVSAYILMKTVESCIEFYFQELQVENSKTRLYKLL